jgi:hypothetical protein
MALAGRLPAVDADPGEREFAATYEILWKGVHFGAERLLVERAPDGRRRPRRARSSWAVPSSCRLGG